MHINIYIYIYIYICIYIYIYKHIYTHIIYISCWYLPVTGSKTTMKTPEQCITVHSQVRDNFCQLEAL